MKAKFRCKPSPLFRFWVMMILQIGPLVYFVGFGWVSIFGKNGDHATSLEVAITMILGGLFVAIALTGWTLVVMANTDSVSGMVAQRYNVYSYLTILSCVATASFSRHRRTLYTPCAPRAPRAHVMQRVRRSCAPRTQCHTRTPRLCVRTHMPNARVVRMHAATCHATMPCHAIPCTHPRTQLLHLGWWDCHGAYTSPGDSQCIDHLRCAVSVGNDGHSGFPSCRLTQSWRSEDDTA